MKEFNENDFLMLSGIQHFIFCRRQWALIHIEQQWEENIRTIEGQHIHNRVNQPMIREKRGDKLIVRALPIHSYDLGINGICDVVEFIQDPTGIELTNEIGKYIPIPVEYKRGKPKNDRSDILQLVAQAMCLEEMFLCEVKIGYIFYNEIKHRIEVPISPKDKDLVRSYFSEMHSYFRKKYTPKVKPGKHCKSCSLFDICLPDLMSKRSVKSYIAGMLDK